MNESHESEKKPVFSEGVYCLKLEDKEHSTQFVHLNPVNFSFFLFTHTVSHLIWFVLLFLNRQLIDLLIHFYWNSTHSTQQGNIEESIEQCETAENSTLNLISKKNSKEREIPNSISTLTHLHTFKLLGNQQYLSMNMNAKHHYTIKFKHVSLNGCNWYQIWMTNRMQSTHWQNFDILNCLDVKSMNWMRQSPN
jgi:hypothetical protein